MTADETTDETSEKITEDNKHLLSKKTNQGKKEETKETQKLHLKDWLALIIAALQTVLLPVVLLLGFLLIITVIVAILF